MSLYGKIMKIQRICKEHLDCNKCPYYKVHELTGNEYCPWSSAICLASELDNNSHDTGYQRSV